MTHSRTYAQAISGTTQQMSFNSTTKEFNLVYTILPNCAMPTEIYLNEQIHYPQGFTVNISPANAARWEQPEKNYLAIHHQINTPTLLSIQIVAK